MTLVSTSTLASPASVIEFASIPSTGTDLLLTLSLRWNFSSSTGFQGVVGRFNTDTGSNYSSRYLYGTGSTRAAGANAIAGTNFAEFGYEPVNANNNEPFCNISVYIPNYASSSAKSFSSDAVGERDATNAHQTILAGRWTGTAAINNLKIYIADGSISMSVGSTASLYLITKGSGGATTSP
jgi:hypothetical protein